MQLKPLPKFGSSFFNFVIGKKTSSEWKHKRLQSVRCSHQTCSSNRDEVERTYSELTNKEAGQPGRTAVPLNLCLDGTMSAA